MAKESIEFRKLKQRESSLTDWLSANAPQCGIEQKHLMEGNQERVYWHYGYLIALRDVLRLFTGEATASQGKEDMPGSSPLG